MFCTNCGQKQSEEARFCTACGSNLETELHADESASIIETTASNKDYDPTLDEEIITFVGKNSDYYKRKWEAMDLKEKKKKDFSFNAAGFFLSLLWLGYRKMYKQVFFIALAFLAVDVTLYVVGYQYQLDRLIDPIDRSIGTTMSVLLGFYGNALYRNHAEKKVLNIRQTTSDPSAREIELKKQGGKGFVGLLISILIFVSVYVVPSYFVPINLNEIDSVKYTEFYDYPGVTMEELFSSMLDDGEWIHVENTSDYDIISYDGEINVDDYIYDISIVFIDEGQDEVEVLYVVVDDEELDLYDSNDFLEYLITEHENR